MSEFREFKNFKFHSLLNREKYLQVDVIDWDMVVLHSSMLD
jgi:hypothetical protein